MSDNIIHTSSKNCIEGSSKNCIEDLVVRPNNYVYHYNDETPKLYQLSLNNYGPKEIKINFPDGEGAVFKNAYDMQDFLNQINHFHDLEVAFQKVVNKLLETKPELEEWVKKNFDVYLKNN